VLVSPGERGAVEAAAGCPLRLNTVGAQAIPVLRKTPGGFRSLRAVCGGFMPLRGVHDRGGAEPPREPCLNVTDLSRDGREPLLQLSGAALAALSRTAKRRVVATALAGLAGDGSGCVRTAARSAYLSLTLPTSRLVSITPTSESARSAAMGAALP
jgi:hypothetical protein